MPTRGSVKAMRTAYGGTAPGPCISTRVTILMKVNQVYLGKVVTLCAHHNV